MLINDRLSTILPTVGAFRRRSMQVKWLSCKGLRLLSHELQKGHQGNQDTQHKQHPQTEFRFRLRHSNSYLSQVGSSGIFQCCDVGFRGNLWGFDVSLDSNFAQQVVGQKISLCYHSTLAGTDDADGVLLVVHVDNLCLTHLSNQNNRPSINTTNRTEE